MKCEADFDNCKEDAKYKLVVKDFPYKQIPLLCCEKHKEKYKENAKVTKIGE